MKAMLASALVASALAAACGGFDVPDGRRNGSGSESDAPAASAPEVAAPVAHLEDAQAVTLLEKYCRGCHDTSKNGMLNASWPMPATLTHDWLETTELTSSAYELVRRKVAGLGEGAYPSPMPAVALDASQMQELRDLLGWFEERLPFNVYEADVRHGRKPSGSPRPELHFTCKNVATTRTFLGRFTRTLFDRDPTDGELTAFAADLDTPVTPAMRARFLKGLRGSWKEELRSKGLAKLARSVATAGSVSYPGIAPAAGSKEPLPAAVLSELGQEFHQLTLAHYDTWDYRDYFTNNVVMTTPTTAPLYGCATASGWQECTMSAPRSGFFTTLGYLNMNGQSFISGEANNSRRFSGMYFTLTGEGPPREGKLGSVAGAPPDCIDASDIRERIIDPATGKTQMAGAAAILHTGQNCQSCHLARGVAAGMVVFRPFSSTGSVFDAATFGLPGMPDAADYAQATSGPWVYRPTPGAPQKTVDAAFFRSLLTAPPKACVSADDPNQPSVKIGSVGELAAHFIAKRDAVARGFARHAHRAFSKAPRVTLEMEVRAMEAFDAGHTTYPDLIESYIGSDSFACDEEL